MKALGRSFRWSGAAGGRRSAPLLVMYLIVIVISAILGALFGAMLLASTRQRGAGGGDLHDRQHALVADHAAAVRRGADDHLLRPAGAEGGLRPPSARARRGQRARCGERRGVERARRLRARRGWRVRAAGGAARRRGRVRAAEAPRRPVDAAAVAAAAGARAAGTGSAAAAGGTAGSAARSGQRAPERRSARRRRPSGARATEGHRAEPRRAVAALVAVVALARCWLRPRARAGGRTPPSRARRRARSCEERRFHGSDVPRPFAGLLRWLGERLQPVGDFFDDLAVARPRRAAGASTRCSAGSSCSSRGLLARGSIGRRAAAAARAARARSTAREDPAALEREADRAAAAGEWETAVRLRFRAGLLRLDAREADRVPPVADHRRGRRGDRLPAFDRVGADFDEIAYGGRPRGRGRRSGEPRGLAARAERGAMSRLPLPKSGAGRAGAARARAARRRSTRSPR